MSGKLTQYGKDKPGIAGFSKNTSARWKTITEKSASLIPR